MSITLHTDVGDLKIELFCDKCPRTCENFLALCASDYYNGCLFHRNIKGFMVQTGDPTGTGKGGNSIWERKFEDEFSDELTHSARGMVSMANNGPNTNASQFFITYTKQPHLDFKYTVFGKVIDGFDTLDELEKCPVNPKNFRPLKEIRLNAVTIHANPIAGGGGGFGGNRGHYHHRGGPHHGRRNKDSHSHQLLLEDGSPTVQMFAGFQLQLDARYDKYERLVKLSRDVTIESKRVIFLLHRVSRETNADSVLNEASLKLADIRESLLREIAFELRNFNYYQFVRAFSPGLQEYIEAVTFYHFLATNDLVPLSVIQNDLYFMPEAEETESDQNQMAVSRGENAGGDESNVEGAAAVALNEEGQCQQQQSSSSSKEESLKVALMVTPLDYMLGLADLTGEVMRRCINAVSQGDLKAPFPICEFLRDMYTCFLKLGNCGGRDVNSKVRVLAQSVRKVEQACYTIRVRGSEISAHNMADMLFFTNEPEVGQFDSDAIFMD